MCILNLFITRITFKIIFNSLVFIIFSALTLIVFEIDFLGVVYIIVYAGAILILFLSVLILVDLRSEEIRDVVSADKKNLLEIKKLNILKFLIIFSYFFGNFYLYVTSYSFYNYVFDDLQNSIWYRSFNLRNSIYWISEILYDQEVLLFLSMGLIFLLAMVGSVSLVLRDFKPDVTKWSHVIFKKNDRDLFLKRFFK